MLFETIISNQYIYILYIHSVCTRLKYKHKLILIYLKYTFSQKNTFKLNEFN